jgi:hypothetical protein
MAEVGHNVIEHMPALIGRKGTCGILDHMHGISEIMTVPQGTFDTYV